MNILKTSLLAFITIFFLFTSCGKEKLEITGTFSFTEISSDNSIYGFERIGGEAVTITASDIDKALFDDCSQVQFVDNIRIVSDDRLEYKAYDRWNDSEDFQIRESSYSLFESETTGNTILEFTYSDEFGNEDIIRLRVVGNVLTLSMFVYVEEWNSSIQPDQFFFDHPDFVVSGGNGENRLSSEEGDKLYMMVYEQRYTK